MFFSWAKEEGINKAKERLCANTLKELSADPKLQAIIEECNAALARKIVELADKQEKDTEEIKAVLDGSVQRLMEEAVKAAVSDIVCDARLKSRRNYSAQWYASEELVRLPTKVSTYDLIPKIIEGIKFCAAELLVGKTCTNQRKKL